MAISRQHLKTTTVSKKGQITVSADARHSLGIAAGDPLMELVLDGCVVYMPADLALEDLQKRAQAALTKTGITVDMLKANVEARKEARLMERYPDLSNDTAP